MQEYLEKIKQELSIDDLEKFNEFRLHKDENFFKAKSIQHDIESLNSFIAEGTPITVAIDTLREINDTAINEGYYDLSLSYSDNTEYEGLRIRSYRSENAKEYTSRILDEFKIFKKVTAKKRKSKKDEYQMYLQLKTRFEAQGND